MESAISKVLDIRYLDGKQIVRWRADEMALGGGGSFAVAEDEWEHEPVVWADPAVPFLQCTSIDIHLHDGTAVRMLSDPDVGNMDCGLYLRTFTPAAEEPGKPAEPEDKTGAPAIFRTRDLDELPLGLAQVTIVREERPTWVVEAELRIAGHVVRLLSAEVEERSNGGFRIVELDESILLQLDGAKPVRKGETQERGAGSPESGTAAKEGRFAGAFRAVRRWFQ
ncbi:MAG: hypothetical protein V4505_11250 [Pseudomonadota bacterium]